VSPGADKVTSKEYAKNLEENLSDLCYRLRWGTYVAPPVERAWLDKEDGRITIVIEDPELYTDLKHPDINKE
jgi:hypothetical protein